MGHRNNDREFAGRRQHPHTNQINSFVEGLPGIFRREFLFAGTEILAEQHCSDKRVTYTFLNAIGHLLCALTAR